MGNPKINKVLRKTEKRGILCVRLSRSAKCLSESKVTKRGTLRYKQIALNSIHRTDRQRFHRVHIPRKTVKHHLQTNPARHRTTRDVPLNVNLNLSQTFNETVLMNNRVSSESAPIPSI